MANASKLSPGSRMAKLQTLVDDTHHETLVQAIARARVSVWISTANLKEMMIEAPVGTVARAKGRYRSILETFSSLAGRGVEIRILHASTPSRPFRERMASLPSLSRSKQFTLRMCPRTHMKIVAIDGAWLYLGSANFTGAGLGAKAVGRRNFEMGIATEDEFLLDVAQGRFDQIWSGAECGSCKLRAQCPKPLDMKREIKGDMKPGPKPKTRVAERSLTKPMGPRSRAKLPAK